MPHSIRQWLFVFAIAASPCAVAETPDRMLTLSHPGVKWHLQFEFPNALEQYNNYKEGAGSYAYGQTLDQRKLFSMALHNFPGATDAKSCREVDAANVRKHPVFASHEITETESGDSAYLRTRGISQIEGQSVFGQHVHRFVFRDGLCAKVHVSSMYDETAISAELMQAAESMAIRDNVADVTRWFHVPPKNALAIHMPQHWGFETSNPAGSPARTLTLRTPDGHFQFMLTAFAGPADRISNDSATLRTVESSRDRVLTAATQSDIAIQTLKGRHAEGHYFFASDKSLAGKLPVPGNWKHMRQGMIRAGTLFATFTIFSNDESAPDALHAMRAVENIEFKAE